MEEKSDILVVYGQHLDELFAAEVGRELKKLGRDDFRIKEFDGHPDIMKHYRHSKHYSAYLRNRGYFNRFVKENLPVDYVINLHDNSPGNEQMRKLIENNGGISGLPAASTWYTTRFDINVSLEDTFIRYCTSINYKSVMIFSPNKHYMPKYFDKIDIEFHPLITNLNDSLFFTVGLINLFQHVKRF